MRKVIEADYDQLFLLPLSLDEMLERDHPARFIREFVSEELEGSLDLKMPGHLGGTVYSPTLLLRAWVYGYFQKIRSCRAMENACINDIGAVWLTGNTKPDHNTLWRFWRDNKKAIGGVFKKTVQVALKAELVGLALQAVDGTKIQAVVSGRRGYSLEQNQQLLGLVEQAIRDQERGIEATISRDSNTPRVKLPKTLQGKQELKQKIREAMEEIRREERKHCHPHEPEARRVKLDERNRFGHNAQVAVDAKERIIVGAEVVPAESDAGQLLPMIEQARQQTGATPPTLADGGYSTGETLRQAQEAGLEVVMPLPSSSQNKDQNPYHASMFVYDKERDAVVCPQGKELAFSRERVKNGTRYRVYRSSAVCRQCPVKDLCTKSRHGRCIDLSANHEAIERHRQKMSTEPMRELYRLRSQIVEPVFAHIKEHGKFRRWTVRGLENVRGQWQMLCATWNLGRLYKHWKTRRGTPGPASCVPKKGLAGQFLKPSSALGRFCQKSMTPIWPEPAFMLAA